MPTQSVNQVTGGISPSEVRSLYTFTAGIILFKNCEFGDYPPVASEVVKDSGMLVRIEPQTLRPQAASTVVSDITTRL